ncbi:MAG: DNA repair protein RecO [Flavobacteriales bacterium]|nr:DNA repair protein RecO [Flavobacteriales bacterium]
MQETFDGIVIRSRNYSDNSIILKCYTKQSGVVSFIARGVKKRKKSHVMALFQALSIVEISSYSKNKLSELKNLRDIKANTFYKNLQFDPIKSGLSIFLAEMLDLSLHEEEENEHLYSFLESSFHYLDEIDDFANFHIAFLIELSKHLGFYPHISDYTCDYFDLEHGIFYRDDKKMPYMLNGIVIDNLKLFLGTKFVDSGSIVLNKEQRRKLLKLIISYYSLHISGFREPKSLEVLHSLYN